MGAHPSAPARRRPFAVTLSVFNARSEIVTNFVGAVTLTAVTALGQTVSITPKTVSDFVNGVWTGTVTVLQPATNITLVARDQSGIVGVSTPFDAANEFGVFVSLAPNPVMIGFDLTNLVQVINTGPDVATGVRLTNVVPMHVDVISVTSSQGACTNDQGVITCDLQSLGVDASAFVTVVCAGGPRVSDQHVCRIPQRARPQSRQQHSPGRRHRSRPAPVYRRRGSDRRQHRHDIGGVHRSVAAAQHETPSPSNTQQQPAAPPRATSPLLQAP